MWSGAGETRPEEGGGVAAAEVAIRRVRHQKSADLDVLSGSSSSSGSSIGSSATEEEGSSNTPARLFSLRHIPAFVGDRDDAEEEREWQAHPPDNNNVSISRRKCSSKQLQDGGSINPSPESTDTARISTLSFGTVAAGVSEGGDSLSVSQDHDELETPLTNWVHDGSHSRWKGEREGTTRERQTLRAEQRRRQQRVREEAAVAAAAEAAAAGGDIAAVAAAAVAAAAAAADREGFGPRVRRLPQPRSHPPRKPGQLRVRGSHGENDDGDNYDVEEGNGGQTAVAVDGQRVRLSAHDFKTPVRQPLSGSGAFAAAAAAAAAAAPAAGRGGGEGGGGERERGVCERCCASCGAMPTPETAGARTCGCKPAGMFSQTGEMEFVHSLKAAASGGNLERGAAGARGSRAGEAMRQQNQLGPGDGGDDMKEEEPERRASSTHSFTYSLSSTSSRGRERGPGGGIGGKQSSSDTVDRSLRSVSRLAASEIRRAEDLVGVIGHHPELGGSHPELVDSLRMTSLRDPGSQRSTSFQDTGSGRMTSLRDSGSHRISSLLDTGSSRKTSLRDSGTQRTISLMDTGSSSGSVGSRRNSGGSERRRRRGLLGGLKKGMGVVWEKIAADHPEPLQIDKRLSKEEQKAKHLQMEIRRRNDWQTNSMAEQHVLRTVLMKEDEKF